MVSNVGPTSTTWETCETAGEIAGGSGCIQGKRLFKRRVLNLISAQPVCQSKHDVPVRFDLCPGHALQEGALLPRWQITEGAPLGLEQRVGGAVNALVESAPVNLVQQFVDAFLARRDVLLSLPRGVIPNGFEGRTPMRCQIAETTHQHTLGVGGGETLGVYHFENLQNAGRITEYERSCLAQRVDV